MKSRKRRATMNRRIFCLTTAAALVADAAKAKLEEAGAKAEVK